MQAYEPDEGPETTQTAAHSEEAAQTRDRVVPWIYESVDHLIDPPQFEWKSGATLSAGGIVYDFEGTDLALIISPTPSSTNEALMAKKTSCCTNLHLLEWKGAVTGPPGLIFEQTDFIKTPESVRVMLNWATLGEFVKLSQADEIETVSCCTTHDRSVHGKRLDGART